MSRTLDLDEFDQEEVTLRVVMGPQDRAFTKAGRETFLNEEYVVTSDFDRMGCRLEGPFIAYKETADIISDGIAFGSVQVPSHGKPIILLSDRQTTGGYAKIATVISVDIPSGIHTDTGRILGTAVRASETVTFAFEKPGLYLPPGSICAGTIHTADIGITGCFAPGETRYYRMEQEDLVPFLQRDPLGNKSDRSHVVL